MVSDTYALWQSNRRRFGNENSVFSLGLGPKAAACLVPADEWDGDTGIDALLEQYYEETALRSPVRTWRGTLCPASIEANRKIIDKSRKEEKRKRRNKK